MSRIVIDKRVCDRCGTELKLYPGFKFLSKNAFSQIETRDDWGNGYPTDAVKELCQECKHKFDDFMDNKPVSEGR